MGRFCRWAVRGADAGRVGRVIVGWFLLVVAVTVTQAVTGVWSLAAQHTPSPSSAASDTVLAWGQNNDGELGDGTTTNRSTPVDVDLPAGTEVTAIAAVGDHSLALTSAGTVLAWGQNVRGQLGDGTTTSNSTPVDVDLPAGTEVTAIAGGDDHSLAVTSAGTVLAWGQNDDVELGDGTTTDRDTPVNVDLPPGTEVTDVAAHGDHSLAVTSAGTVLAWGNNSSGQLGDGTTTSNSTPVDVDLPAGTEVTAIAGGDSHSLAVTSAGTVLAWGNNSSGQLGDGTTTDRDTPADVNLPTGVTITAIAAGDDHSLALTAPPTSTTTLQVTPANPTADQDITLTATVTCNVDTPTGTITFRTNGETLATVPLTTSATATHTTTLPTGTHTLTAHHTSTNSCPNSQSPPTTITINPDLPITGPTLTTTTGAATLSILAGAALIYATRRRRPHHHQPE
ncbi:RCC1 domain-containing protein [Salinispora arenicola]|uniref:RCC1 domain-containing protein n=1 Tax=Salinispora arenicola TaxID=168697 RepID=UPI0016A209E0|nr:Ig-like domain repeat protein [Salinispora arenicola]NIL63779.1 cell wall anchor protein [Salinispora arenicola]